MFNTTQSMGGGMQGDPQGILAKILGMGGPQPVAPVIQPQPTNNQPQAYVPTSNANGPLAKMFAMGGR